MGTPSGIQKTFVTELTEVTTTKKEANLGVIRWHGNRAYKYIQYKEGAAATDGVAGEATAYYCASGSCATNGYTANHVTSDYSDSARIGAGILQAAMSDNEYGWIQIKGQATLTINLTAGADGNALTTVGAGDGTLDVSAAVTDHLCAVAVDASADSIICDFPF